MMVPIALDGPAVEPVSVPEMRAYLRLDHEADGPRTTRFGRIEGPFQITGVEYRGGHADAVTFEMALESAGAPSFAPS